jgi:predicted NAD/FAD-binding protein
MRIAVIGSGISGLGAAYALRQKHSVEVFEQDTRAGGHTNTISVETGARTLPLDTGFIVHSRPNYPNLVRLFDELGVRTQPSQMSFAVSCRGCGLEYSRRRPGAQRHSTESLSPAVGHREVHANSRGGSAVWPPRGIEGLTLDDYVRTERFSHDFRNHFLVPLTAALWSTSPQQSADFPIDHAVRFFAHHCMLGFRRSTWRTVTGGAPTYVDAIVERLGDHVHLGRGVRRVVRTPHGAELTTHDGEKQEFDAVVLATHADTSLALLADPSDEETRLLGSFPYTRNAAVLHADASLLPRKRAARASWNYQLAACDSRSKEPTMTYYVNRLQGLSEAEHYCVTLNQATDIAESSVLERIEYEHPLFSAEGVRAQSQLGAIQGSRHTYFCGAWQAFGFHEDGLTSGLRVAEALGASW